MKALQDVKSGNQNQKSDLTAIENSLNCMKID